MARRFRVEQAIDNGRELNVIVGATQDCEEVIELEAV